MSDLVIIDDPHQDMLDGDPFPPGSALSTVWRQNKMRANSAMMRWKMVAWFEETLPSRWKKEGWFFQMEDSRPVLPKGKEISLLDCSHADPEGYTRLKDYAHREIMEAFGLRVRSDAE